MNERIDRTGWISPQGLHAASGDDTSDQHFTYPTGYDSECGWCWLNAPHTEQAHNSKLTPRREQA